MFPDPRTYTVEVETSLHEFVKSLGKDILYAYDQRMVVVLVNGVRLWPTARVKPFDKVAIIPIVTGG